MSIRSDVFYKGNRSLKPYQPGMAKTGEVQQSFVGSPHLRARFIPVYKSLYFRLSGAVADHNCGVVLFGTVQSGMVPASCCRGLGVILGTLI